MTTLPVREMVLYKNGIGFFRREGILQGTSLELNFRHDEINDILKSLAILDSAGGQVLGIQYQTPMDVEARLADTSIRLSDTASLRDLLRDLRGRQVALLFENTPGSAEMVSGRIIGIDEGRDNAPAETGRGDTRLTLLADDGAVSVFALEHLRSFHLLDAQSSHDLSYFLDTGMSSGTRRTVQVRLSEGDHQLSVYYVAPSPTWRVSYRLFAESDQDAESGKALLQGWGIFDNRLEEDLENVRVTLVAGQPISFIYELYASRIPPRPVIEDETRIAPAPVEFASYGGMELLDDLDNELLSAPGAAKRSRAMSAPAPAAGLSIERTANSFAPLIETRDAGELFEYAVTTPVTVKRGESALVPIISSQVSYRRELLFNEEKLRDHPVAALRFDNHSGLTVERGPVTVVEDGAYKGEAIIPFTKDGGSIYVPYAVELGVNIRKTITYAQAAHALNIKDSFLVIQEFHIQQNTYTLENTTARSLTVTLETRKLPFYELFETALPDDHTPDEWRWRVAVSARGSAEFTVRQRVLHSRRQALRDLKYQSLNEYLSSRLLDRAVYARLKGLLDTLQAVKAAAAHMEQLEQESASVYKQQEQLRANLTALQPTGQEAALRNRVLGQLESSQSRLEAIQQQIAADEQTINAGNAAVQQFLKELG